MHCKTRENWPFSGLLCDFRVTSTSGLGGRFWFFFLLTEGKGESEVRGGGGESGISNSGALPRLTETLSSGNASLRVRRARVTSPLLPGRGVKNPPRLKKSKESLGGVSKGTMQAEIIAYMIYLEGPEYPAYVLHVFYLKYSGTPKYGNMLGNPLPVVPAQQATEIT